MFPLNRFTDYIRQNELFNPSQRILLAVSGGKDSVLMVHLFHEAGFDFGIAHCNFGLRGGESQRDELFVKTLATTLGVPVYITQFKTKAYAAEQRISTQMAARELRYQWFEEIRDANCFDYIAAAHHQDDAIETVLLNLVRGTGIAGLHGILPKRERLIRPMLFMSRKEIDEQIKLNKLDYVEDSSNLSNTYARNKIRLDVVPHLKLINPNLEETFEQNIIRFTETEIVLQQRIDALRSEGCEERDGAFYFRVDFIKTLHPQKLLLTELLRPFTFQAPVVADILSSLDKQSGTSFYSATHRITLDRGMLVITSGGASAEMEHRTIHPSDHLIKLDHGSIQISYSDVVGYESNKAMAFIDADKLIFPLILRNWQEGDKFVPLGMKHHKKLSDFFIDEKVPLPQKSTIPLVINGNGDIVWIAGMRQDNRYKVAATTKKVAIFEQKFK